MKRPTSDKVFVVIGSNCFTGSHIVDALLDNPDHRVIGVSRSPEYHSIFLPYKRHRSPNFVFHQIDLVRGFDALVKVLDKEEPSVVINAAALSEVALSNERPVEYFETNTVGIVRVCNFLRTRPYLKHYVHISSAEILGSCATPAAEDALFNPSTPYAVSKAATDQYLNTLIMNFAFPATLIRSTNVYGRHQQLFKIIPRTVIYIKRGKTIELHGGGTSMKSFIHVRDVVQGIMLAIERGHSGTYHFTVPSDQTVADVVRFVCQAMGRDFEQVTRMVGERLGQDTRYWLDCSKVQRDLGWKAAIPFAQGVREVIDWIESNWEVILHEPHVYVHKT